MSAEVFHGRISLCCGDSLHFLRDQPAGRYDSVVTDPPYALVSIQKRFGRPGSAPVKVGNINASNDLKAAYARASAGFMGKNWDTGETAFAVEFWAEVLRVLKPGGHVVAFGGTRTYHRLACAIEDAGFEIRDQLGWCFGSGFPKSHNAGHGWGTALKPAWEPICLARKPLIGTVAANVLQHGTGAINIDGCRIHPDDADLASMEGRSGASTRGLYQGNIGISETWKPANGRWPANIIHDGSDEVIAAFPQTSSGEFLPHHCAKGTSQIGTFDIRDRSGEVHPTYGDEGSAARFFYAAKADADDRIGSKHPTIKPVDLMQWLVRLVTPKGGLVLDPFAGTGTTAEACFREGMRCALVERETEYQADIRRRMALLLGGPDERARESIKARTAGQPIDNGPLFSLMAAE